MSTNRNQSQIAEVRDQLSIDYADGKYLNVATNNLGLSRPVFGFSDDSWRAVAKALALQHKQIRTRFHKVLAILFGPYITEVGTIAEDIGSGDRTFFVNESSQFPQTGTVVIDEGLANEETLDYCFIDHSTGQVFLAPDVQFSNSHPATPVEDTEAHLIVADSAGTKLIVTDASLFPTTEFPFTGVIGRGTPNEEVVEITAVDALENSVTIATALSNIHDVLTPSSIHSQLALPYSAGATFLTLDSSAQFGNKGTVILRARTPEFVVDNTTSAGASTTTSVVTDAGSFSTNVHAGMFVQFADDTSTLGLQGEEAEIASNTGSTLTLASSLSTAPADGDTFVIIQPPFNATAGTVNDVTVNGGTFTPDFQVGNTVVFDGNVTPGLSGIEAKIIANTDDTLTFAEALSTAPDSGDTFRVRPVTEFQGNSGNDNVLSLKAPLRDLIVPEDAPVELMEVGSLVSLAPVQVKAGGWDTYEVDPRNFEILLPESIADPTDPRSASYLHTTLISPTPSTTLASGTSAGDEFIDVTSAVDFPVVGVVTIDPGGVDEVVGYYRFVEGDFEAIAGTVNDVTVSGSLFDSGEHVGRIVRFADDTETVALRGIEAEISSNTDDTLTFTAPLGTAPTEGDVFTIIEHRLQIATQTISNAHSSGVTVDLYQPAHGSTDILIGDPFNVDDTFPGPYLYEFPLRSPSGTIAETTLDSLIPGPTTVELEQVAGNSALEVKDASAFDLVDLPYNAIVGEGTGNKEQVTIFDVNLKNRVRDITVATGVTGGTGTTELELSNGGASTPEFRTDGASAEQGADFPDSQGYRVIIDLGGANEEVVYVLGVETSPDRLVLQEEMKNSHLVGESVELMADTISTDSLTDAHIGKIEFTSRSTARDPNAADPVFTKSDIEFSELVQPLIDELSVASSAGLDPEGGIIIFNFGREKQTVNNTLDTIGTSGDVVLSLASTTEYPAVDPTGASFVAIVSPGTAIEEIVVVTDNNTTTNKLTINDGDFGLINTHPVGATVRWEPGVQENVEYSSITGDIFSFSSAIVLQSTHSPDEAVIASSSISQPRTNGFDYPFRMPPDIRERVNFLLDLIRAAGVEVSIIESR